MSITLTWTCFQILKDVSDDTGIDINEYDVIILHNNIYHHSEDIYNSMNRYFPNSQCMLLQNHARVHNPKI